MTTPGEHSAPKIEGNRCQRGEKYAFQELLNPVRIFTGVLHVEGSCTPLSVKTSAPVPKSMFPACAAEIHRLKIGCPVSMGEILLRNIAGTGTDLIATCELSQ